MRATMVDSAARRRRDSAPLGLWSLHGEFAADSTAVGAAVVGELFAKECESLLAERDECSGAQDAARARVVDE